MRREHRLRARCAERELPREHLVADDRERVEIGARINVPLTARLFGRHVSGRAHRHAGAGHTRHARAAAGLVDRARDAEIGEHRVAIFEQDVLRLDVAVDDPFAMRVSERIRDLAQDPRRLVHGHLGMLLEMLPE